MPRTEIAFRGLLRYSVCCLTVNKRPMLRFTEISTTSLPRNAVLRSPPIVNVFAEFGLAGLTVRAAFELRLRLPSQALVPIWGLFTAA